MKSRCQIPAVTAAIEVIADQTFPSHKKHANGKNRQNHCHPDFIAEGMANTFLIFLTKILCSENSCTGQTAENTKIVYKHQLVDDGYAGHLLGSNLPYHNIIQKAYKICYAILYHNRHCDQQHHFVKCLISNKFFSHIFPHGKPLPFCYVSYLSPGDKLRNFTLL